MRIQEVHPNPDHTLLVITEDGRIGLFDVTPYLHDEAFAESADLKAAVKHHGFGVLHVHDLGRQGHCL